MTADNEATRYLFEQPDALGNTVPIAVIDEQKEMIDEMLDGDESPITDFDLTVDVEASAFVASRDGVELGGVPFLEKDDRIVLLSTAVLPAFRGKGLGAELTRRVLDVVSERKQRVTVMCPVFRTFFDQNPDYAYLLDRDVPGLTRPRR